MRSSLVAVQHLEEAEPERQVIFDCGRLHEDQDLLRV